MAAALVAGAVDRAAEAGVDGGENALRALIERLQRRFADMADSSAEAALSRVAQTPDDLAAIRALGAAIDTHVTGDDLLAHELKELVRSVSGEQAGVATVRQLAVGDGVVQIADVTNSQINVNADRRPPKPGA
jgi:hypothetical protein